MKLREIIESDRRIIDSSKRDGNVFIFDHPDFGPPVRGQVPDKIDAGVLAQWVAHVRGTYNARFDSETIEKNGGGPRIPSGDERVPPPTSERSGSEPPTTVREPESKAPVAEYLRAQIADLESRKAEQEGIRDAALRRLERAGSEIADIDRILGALRGLHAPEVRGTDSQKDSLPKARRRPAASPTVQVVPSKVPVDDEGRL